jgi:amino acid transporter
MTENPQQPGAPTPGGQQAQGQQPYGATQQQPYPAPGQQDSKFGTAAYNPGAVGQETGEPKSWMRLKTLTLASFAISMISGIVSLLGVNEDAIRQQVELQLEAQGQPATTEMVDQLVGIGLTTGIAFAVGGLVASLVLYLVVFFGLRGGKNWARILGTILAAVGALFTLVGLFQIGTTMAVDPVMGSITLVLGVLFVAVNIWWIVTAFSKDVNAYVRMRSGR